MTTRKHEKHQAHLFLFIVIFLFHYTTVFANSPESIDNVETVDAEAFIDLAELTPDLVILDSRISEDRKLGYIEGSISLLDKNTNCQTLFKFIPSKSTATLFYCNGVKCGRSAKAIKLALACGYSNLYWFRGGFEEWLAKGYPYLQK